MQGGQHLFIKFNYYNHHQPKKDEEVHENRQLIIYSLVKTSRLLQVVLRAGSLHILSQDVTTFAEI